MMAPYILVETCCSKPLLWQTFAILTASLRHSRSSYIKTFQVKILKNSICTSQKKNHVSVTKTNRLILFRKMITGNSENHHKQINISFWKINYVVHIERIVALEVRWDLESLLPSASSNTLPYVCYQYLWTEMGDESCDFWHSHVQANSCFIILLFWQVTIMAVADFLLNADSLVAGQYICPL
jgi:hypothetical protein